MIIKVTQDHIDDARNKIKAGIMCLVDCCPLSLAMGPNYYVGRQKVFKEESMEEWALPQNAIDWIALFDTEKAVTPFQFEIDL